MDDPALALKRRVGEAAAELVEDGMVVGLGTGSTADCMIDSLGTRVRAGLRCVGIPSSVRSADRARALGIAIGSFADHPEIDLAIDGADEVERGTLHLIKGLGGALLREKIVVAAARRFVVVADGGKLVDRLGERTPVPVEVSSFGWEATALRLGQLGARATPRSNRAGSLFVTDGGNMILDCAFGPIDDPAATEAAIRAVVGVFESGLFIGRTATVLVAEAGGIARHEAA